MVGGAAQRKAHSDAPGLWFSDPIDGRTVLVLWYILERGFIDHRPILDMKDQRRREGVGEWRGVGMTVLHAGAFMVYRPRLYNVESGASFREMLVDISSRILEATMR